MTYSEWQQTYSSVGSKLRHDVKEESINAVVVGIENNLIAKGVITDLPDWHPMYIGSQCTIDGEKI